MHEDTLTSQVRHYALVVAKMQMGNARKLKVSLPCL